MDHVSSRTRGLNWDLCIYLNPYLVYTSSEGPGETALAQARLSLHCTHIRCVPNSDELSQLLGLVFNIKPICLLALAVD